jgi:hypothetical protein
MIPLVGGIRILQTGTTVIFMLMSDAVTALLAFVIFLGMGIHGTSFVFTEKYCKFLAICGDYFSAPFQV